MPRPAPARLSCLALALSAATLTPFSPARAASNDPIVARGAHIVAPAGCNDCHTPMKAGAHGPEPDMSRMLSGHPQDLALPPPPVAPDAPWPVAGSATGTAWAGPWGISYASNLTPDPATGIGGWSREDFIATIRTGRHLGKGRPVLPPMPIPAYRQLDDAELGAVYAYLRTIPAIANRVPAPASPTSR